MTSEDRLKYTEALNTLKEIPYLRNIAENYDQYIREGSDPEKALLYLAGALKYMRNSMVPEYPTAAKAVSKLMWLNR